MGCAGRVSRGCFAPAWNVWRSFLEGVHKLSGWFGRLSGGVGGYLEGVDWLAGGCQRLSGKYGEAV